MPGRELIKYIPIIGFITQIKVFLYLKFLSLAAISNSYQYCNLLIIIDLPSRENKGNPKEMERRFQCWTKPLLFINFLLLDAKLQEW